MAKNIEIESPVINIIGNGTTVKGDITATGDMRIDGSLSGSLHSKGKVVVGPSGVVDGEIKCQSADFSGEVRAKIIVTELLSLKATARLTGDITVSKLAIEPGAKFTGTCNMSDHKTVQPEFKPPLTEKAVESNS